MMPGPSAAKVMIHGLRRGTAIADALAMATSIMRIIRNNAAWYLKVERPIPSGRH